MASLDLGFDLEGIRVPVRLLSLVFAFASALPLAAPDDARAGGLDLSGQPITLLFRGGDYAELTLGASDAARSSGEDTAGVASGDVYGERRRLRAGIMRAASATTGRRR